MAIRAKIPRPVGPDRGTWLDWFEPGCGAALESQPGSENPVGYAQPPLSGQLQFHSLACRFKGFSGPVGSGKSMALAQEALRLAAGNPGLLGLIGAPTYPMLRDVTQRTLFEILEQNDIDYTFRKQENHLTLYPWRSEIIFRSLDNPERLRGTNLAWFGIDEMTYCREAAFLRLQARLRHPSASELCGFGVWTPQGYDWVYRRFVEANDQDYGLVRASPRENIYLPADFYDQLRHAYPERFYRQEALGEYLNVFSGQAYYAFGQANVIHSPQHPLWWALDFNVNPNCSLIGQTINGKIRVLEELVLPDSRTLRACEEFLARSEKWCKVPEPVDVPPDAEGYYELLSRLQPAPLNVYVYGDASAQSQHTSASRTDWQIVKDFLGRYPDRFHAHFRVPSSNPLVKDRVNCLNAMLCNYSGERHLFVDSKCKELQRDLQQVAWKADPHGNILSDLNKSDPVRTHLSDALGYYVALEFPMRRKAGERPGPALL
jgi:Terminase large subunit, T4likevirus-type, N-terminal